ncbi:hypothetical protein [Ramlibacter sp.]|uniref:hypothetical protein n=1 Tax=Ramlibacter sp. TaxID=1917967 RepID=UPI002A65F66C|nr:prokaryotic cytochrome b561 family protein [Ramlibacter sp.]
MRGFRDRGILYAGVLALGALAAGSGLSLWQPVQLRLLADLFGGYEAARRVHFIAMAGISLFVIVHLATSVSMRLARGSAQTYAFSNSGIGCAG